jgi:hypothetical protein
MDVDAWLAAALADADARGLPDLKPLLETLARGTRTLRAADADFGHPVSGRDPSAEEPAAEAPQP